MGLAWVSATALIALLAWRGRHVSRSLALLVALAPAWVMMLLALLSIEDGLEILRLRLRGFEVVNRSGADFRLAASDTEPPQDLPAIALDRVRGFDGTIDVHVDRMASPTTAVNGHRDDRPTFSVRLTYPDDLDVFVGLEDEDHPFPFNRVYALEHGDRITVCPDGDRCETRAIPIRQDRGRWFVGPCALSSWRGGEMSDSTRTLSVLDLYHYEEDRCVPRRVTAETTLWVHEVGGDRPTEDDVRSFLLYQDGRVYLALLDPEEVLTTNFHATRRSEAVTENWSNGEPVRLKLMWKERRFLQERVYDDPTVDRPLCNYAGTPEEEDYSGRRLCKRVRVYLPETELRVTLTDRVRITIPPSRAPAVSLTCSDPARRVDPQNTSRERCEDTPLRAAYAANTRFHPAGTPLLSFPVRLLAGEPISEVLRIDEGPVCGRLSPPCLVAKGRATERAYPIGAIAALGSTDTERHLIDATLFRSANWLWLLLAAASLQVLLIFGMRRAPRERTPLFPAAIVGAVLMLLTVRLLFAYKVVALFPHDQESMDLAVSAIMIVPALLAAVAWPVAPSVEPAARSGWWPLDARGLGGMRAAIVGAVVLVLAARLNIVSPPGRVVTAGWILGLAAISIIASGLVRSMFGSAWAAASALRRALPLDRLRAEDGRLPEALLWGGLAALLLVRGLLAVNNRESLGGVRVLLWFLPAAFFMVGVVLSRLQDAPRKALISTVGIAAFAFLAQWTDKGAGVIVCVPITVIGLFLAARALRRTPAERVVLGAVLAAGLGSGALYTYARLTEASLPPVRDGPTQWAVLTQTEGGRNLLCPVRPKGEAAKLDLDPYASLFELSNTEVRLREYLVPGAANRIGTRESVRVAESLAIMRRYAAGNRSSLWGSGFMSAPVREYGEHELRALLSDGVSSVLIASEGGTVGMVALMSLYLVLLWIGLRHSGLLEDRQIPFRAVWLGLVSLFSLGWMTWFMCAGNIGLLLFSGQNVPFLVVQSGMDVVLPTILFAFALTLPPSEDFR